MTSRAPREFNRRVQAEIMRMRRNDPQKCLFAQDCEETPIKAHSVPRNTLAKLQLYGHVIQPTSKLGKDEKDRLQTRSSLELIGINEASTGTFVCRAHDDIFKEIDQPHIDLENDRLLDLLMYRAALLELWTQLKTLETMLDVRRAVPLYPTIDPEVKLRAAADLVSRLKRQFQIGYRGNSTDAVRAKHVVRKLKTELPFLASASASTSSDIVIDRLSGEILSLEETGRRTGREPNTSWTFIVIPDEKEHAVVTSWIEGSEADDFFDDMKNANGAGLQEVVSVRLLTFCENWFLHPAIWRKYGEKRRQAMTEAFNNFESLLDGRYERTESLSAAKWHERWKIANRHQLNLFRY